MADAREYVVDIERKYHNQDQQRCRRREYTSRMSGASDDGAGHSYTELVNTSAASLVAGHLIGRRRLRRVLAPPSPEATALDRRVIAVGARASPGLLSRFVAGDRLQV